MNLSTLGTAENAPLNPTNDLAFQLGRALAGDSCGRRGEGEPFGPPPGGGFAPRGANPDEIVGQIENKQMPPAKYLSMHPDSNLTDEERQQLIQGLMATLSQSGIAGD